MVYFRAENVCRSLYIWLQAIEVLRRWANQLFKKKALNLFVVENSMSSLICLHQAPASPLVPKLIDFISMHISMLPVRSNITQDAFKQDPPTMLQNKNCFRVACQTLCCSCPTSSLLAHANIASEGFPQHSHSRHLNMSFSISPNVNRTENCEPMRDSIYYSV